VPDGNHKFRETAQIKEVHSVPIRQRRTGTGARFALHSSGTSIDEVVTSLKVKSNSADLKAGAVGIAFKTSSKT